DAALCTSGDYRNALPGAAGRMHHVFDPRTGRSATQAVASASVLADGVRAQWARWQALGARSALLLVPAEAGGFAAVAIDWPAEPQ
ncbi:MAG: FAD:protein FMN transferase, partial [Planctomycetes bacterium]|nr:FAD:protein FMN transferase [Planctomycetota bacterium]